MSQMYLFSNAIVSEKPIIARSRARVSGSRCTDRLEVRLKAKSLWYDEARYFDKCEKLAEYVGVNLGVSPSIILAWQILYDWPNPAWVELPRSGHVIWGEHQENDDPHAHASDPLEEFYNRKRDEGHRKIIAKYVGIVGYNSPCEIDLTEVQATLDRYPITLESLAVGLCLEPRVFAAYARAKGVIEPPHAKINIPLGTQMFNHETFASYVVRHAQHLYRQRGITIRVIAGRMGINWRDLWLLGCRFGCWQLPSPSTLADINDFLRHRKN